VSAWLNRRNDSKREEPERREYAFGRKDVAETEDGRKTIAGWRLVALVFLLFRDRSYPNLRRSIFLLDKAETSTSLKSAVAE
jgi:hypothetical protein